MIADG
jgi:hypothetical protein